MPIAVVLSIVATLISLGTFLLSLLPRFKGVRYRIRSRFLTKTGVIFDFEFVNRSSIPHSISRIQVFLKDEWVDCLELGNTYLEFILKETNKPIKTQDIKGTPLPVQLNIYGASSAIVNFNLNRDYSHPRPTTWEEFFNAAGSESMNSARFRIFVDGVPRVISLDIPDTCLIRKAFQVTIPGSKYLSD